MRRGEAGAAPQQPDGTMPPACGAPPSLPVTAWRGQHPTQGVCALRCTGLHCRTGYAFHSLITVWIELAETKSGSGLCGRSCSGMWGSLDTQLKGANKGAAGPKTVTDALPDLLEEHQETALVPAAAISWTCQGRQRPPLALLLRCLAASAPPPLPATLLHMSCGGDPSLLA